MSFICNIKGCELCIPWFASHHLCPDHIQKRCHNDPKCTDDWEKGILKPHCRNCGRSIRKYDGRYSPTRGGDI